MASPQVNTEPVVAALERIVQRGYTAYTVFEDWVDMMLFALQRRDEPYLEIVADYDEPRDMDHPTGERTVDLFANAFGKLQEQMAEDDADVLGAVYEEMGVNSDNFGQHFTPHTVCETMVEITHAVDEDSDGGNQRTIADPACGSGRMLLSAGRRNPEAVMVGQDKDPLCAKMTALNLCFFNLDGYAILGDSLQLEYRRVWQTTHTPLGGSIRELGESQIADLRESFVERFDSESDGTSEQTSVREEAGQQTLCTFADGL